jgi:hypothetical protein
MVWMLLAVSAVLALPYLVMGPGFIIDDWVFIAQRHFGGFLATGSEPAWLLEARPGAWLVFLLTFGPFYEHPAIIFGLQAAVNAGVAVAFRGLLRRFLPEPHAFAAAVVWLLLPIRSSTDHWGATTNIAVATLLLVIGLSFVIDGARGASRWPHAAISLVSATLCYESVLPVAATAVFGVALLVPSERRRAAATLTCVLAAGLWMLAFTTKSISAGPFDYSAVPSALFGQAAFGSLVLVAIPVLAAGLLAAWRRRSSEAEMLAIGCAVMALSLTAFVRFPVVPLGIGDRVNAVTSFGVALVIASAALSLTRRRLLLALGGCALVLVPVRIGNDADYAWSGDRALHLLAEARPVGDLVVFDDCPLWRDHVTGFLGHWDGGPAARYYFDDPDVEARYRRGEAPIARRRAGDPCQPLEG